MTEPSRIDRAAIAATYRRIAPHLRRTPIVEIDGADFGLPRVPLVFKLEGLQHSGSFKARGAFAHLLGREIPDAGVVAASGGNHGAAVAFAARRLGIRATIFVPTVSAPAKVARIRGYGAELVVEGDRYADALAASERFAAETGALPIHAYDDVETLLGQGTLALELEQQAPGLGAVLVAVGGGGLVGGVAAWYGESTAVVAVEPETAPTLHHALAAGEPVDAPAGGVAADSLAPRRVGARMFPIAQRSLADAVLVPDETILAARHALWETLRVAAEPGGAAAFAALLAGRWTPPEGRPVGVVICGSNTGSVDL